MITSDADVAHIRISEIIFLLMDIDLFGLLLESLGPAIRMLMMLLNFDAGKLAFSNIIVAEFWIS